MIDCENNFCIYCKDDLCMLDEIDITAIGMCFQCFFPDIPSEELERYKQATLARLNKDFR